ncbi:hypothetical protein ACNAUY_08030 [Acinetobacter tibetensis]|uniref:hypothetical protein n=1 Tax=Acinetobacter tibetensis TaxID=2943497 RepID=UPI003A4E1683
MQVTSKRKFIASTATPLVQITFDVYAQKQHFEVQFTVEDEISKKSLAKNLKKTIANLALVKTELSEGDFLTFLAKVVSSLDEYRYHFFDAEKVTNISQLDLLRLFFAEIAQHEEKQREKAAKKALKAIA